MPSMRAFALLLALSCATVGAQHEDMDLSTEEMIDAVELNGVDAFASDVQSSADILESDAIESEELVGEEDDSTAEPETTVKSETTTEPSNTGTQATPVSTGTTVTSVSTGSSKTTASSRSSRSSSSSTVSTESSPSTSSTTTAVVEVNATTTTEATTTTTQASMVQGTLAFAVSGGNASDLVDAFNNDTNGSVASALAASIAAADGAEGVQEGDVTITNVALNTEGRRLQSAHLRSSRALTATESLLVEYEIAVSGLSSAEVAATLNSDAGLAAIEGALTTGLQEIDPSYTVSGVEVTAVAVTVPTPTTSGRDSSFAARAISWPGSLMLACSLASLLLQ